MQTDLEALARRIEHATGPDRALDAEIETAFTDERGIRPVAFFREQVASGHHRPLRFTASLDAAMTLVPEGWRFIIDKRPWAEHRKDGYRCHVWEAPILAYEDNERWAPTPALAMSLAALQAIASLRAQRLSSQAAEGNPS